MAYGFPLTILKWIWEGLALGPVPPMAAYYTLRLVMFILSFILEDWAVYELRPLPRDRAVALPLVASSYVTWTFQTHTFSNSIDTLLVLWCLVLIQRIRANRESTMARSCAALALLGVLGTFNRITFPAFLVVPAIQLVPHLLTRRLRLPILLAVAILSMAIAITMDTEFYAGARPHFRGFFGNAIITPWNNLVYNADTSNLAKHGLHPFWQHFAANLPQLIGPAFPLIFLSSKRDTLFWSAITGIGLLSCFQHQEARFLLPAVPLLLASIELPRRFGKLWLRVWIVFNILAGIVFGIYHQGGVVPAQEWISQQTNVGHVYWWKTYSPPQWLLDGSNSWIRTHDLMGMPFDEMALTLNDHADSGPHANRTLLVAPLNVGQLEEDPVHVAGTPNLAFHPKWTHRKHIGLDDLDFADDGVWPTLERVVGRRGLGILEVQAVDEKTIN